MQSTSSPHPGSSLVLIGATFAAIALSNSPIALSFAQLWERVFLGLSIRQWINDGLMSLFFFGVGLELKRELFIGELSSLKKTILPVMAAVGGMLAPGLIYGAVNYHSGYLQGWGIPVATDIAFALGALTLFGKKTPLGLRSFLSALAIADDLGAILIIGLFYTSPSATTNSLLSLSVLGFLLLALLIVNRSSRLFARFDFGLTLGLGILLGCCLFQADMHPTLAAIITAFALPNPSQRTQYLAGKMTPWVAYAILPVFALANAGVSFESLEWTSFVFPVFLGVFLGLTLGKPIGITLFSYLGVQGQIAHLPKGVSWQQLGGAGCLGGIGFTMSLFIASLAFPVGPLLSSAKVGILAASLVSGFLGYLVLKSEHDAWRNPRSLRRGQAGLYK
jgi:NhaA family Na+:H+ antiporter